MNTEIQEIRERTLNGMRSYMNMVREDHGDPGYTERDIDKCAEIVDAYLRRVASCQHGDTRAVMLAVQDVVLALNVLNVEAGESLIETDQREDLAALIIQSAAAAGVGNGKDDLTEAWREW